MSISSSATPKGIIMTGTKAIVTGAPYVHEFLVMPSRNMRERCRLRGLLRGTGGCARRHDCCPAGWPARRKTGARGAAFSRKYGQSTGVVIFDQVFVPWERVFLAGEWGFLGM